MHTPLARGLLFACTSEIHQNIVLAATMCPSSQICMCRLCLPRHRRRATVPSKRGVPYLLVNVLESCPSSISCFGCLHLCSLWAWPTRRSWNKSARKLVSLQCSLSQRLDCAVSFKLLVTYSDMHRNSPSPDSGDPSYGSTEVSSRATYLARHTTNPAPSASPPATNESISW
ncbi:hypothetical protein F5141DRAFT_1085622 [Pisolithus sp. B1]|nr:hypothetical protein F5141DRAFT_1085622 [Pisolithus sp. B1]